MEEVAGEAASRAVELRRVTEKGARLRKKKALNDLLKALAAFGFTRRRAAVPPLHRTVPHWFSQVSLLAPHHALHLGKGGRGGGGELYNNGSIHTCPHMFCIGERGELRWGGGGGKLCDPGSARSTASHSHDGLHGGSGWCTARGVVEGKGGLLCG